MRSVLAGNDQSVVATIVVILLAVALSFNGVRRVMTSLWGKLLSTRQRDAFRAETTSGEWRTLLLLLLQTTVLGGIILTSALAWAQPALFHADMPTTLIITALSSLWLLFQYSAYFTIGYAFAPGEAAHIWIEGFTASIVILGPTLLLPAIVVLFYPAFSLYAIATAASFYLIARVVFICKSFRIFYTNFASIVYFILYLCSLELVPIVILYHLAVHCATLNSCSGL